MVVSFLLIPLGKAPISNVIDVYSGRRLEFLSLYYYELCVLIFDCRSIYFNPIKYIAEGALNGADSLYYMYVYTEY